MSLQINKDLTKATCIEDLSHLKGLVKSDVYEEEFPIIGKTYKLDSMYIINEWRDSQGRCIPRRLIHSKQDIIKVHLFGWTTQEDMLGFQDGFDYNSFIYLENDDSVYDYFKIRNLNIRTPGLDDKLKQIYKDGISINTPPSLKSLECILSSIISISFSVMLVVMNVGFPTLTFNRSNAFEITI